MHIKIDQNTSAIEEVSRSTITKLYQLSSNNMLDQNSDLIGRLHASAGYRTQVQYLNNTFDNLYVSVDDYYIPWESENTKTVVLGYLFNMESGELTEEVASTLNFPGNRSLRNNSSIESFDELRYFTSVDTIQSQFFQQSTLTSIDLRNVKYLNNYAFALCGSLVSVKNTESLLTISNYAFNRTTALSYIGPLASVTTIGNSAFSKAGLTNHAFDFLNLTQIGYYPFSMNNKKSVYLPKLTTFAANTNIYQDTDRPGITFGPDIQSFVNTSSASTSVNKCEYGILYLRDVTTLPCFAFTAMCGNIVINNTTPPICNTQSVSSLNCFAYRVSDVQATPFWKVPTSNGTSVRANQDITIYVPSSAYNAYLTADVWKDLPEGTIQKLEESTIYTNRVATKDAWEAAGKPDVLIEEYM